jgi:hypothetical protein
MYFLWEVVLVRAQDNGALLEHSDRDTESARQTNFNRSVSRICGIASSINGPPDLICFISYFR